METVLEVEEEIRNDVLMLIIFPIPKNPSLASVSLLNNFLSRDLFLNVWSKMLYIPTYKGVKFHSVFAIIDAK